MVFDQKAYLRQYYLDNKEKINKRNLEHYHANSKVYTEASWRNSIKRKFGMTPEDYEAMLERQNGCCAICRTDEPGGRGKWHIDHCHETNEVRGLLCQSCNMGIGQLKDDVNLLQKAIGYLKPIDMMNSAGNTQWL